MTVLTSSPPVGPVSGGRSRPVATSLIVLTGVFLSSLDLFIVNIAFPSISATYHGESLSSISWVLSAYTIVFAAALVPAGRWAGRAQARLPARARDLHGRLGAVRGGADARRPRRRSSRAGARRRADAADVARPAPAR